MALTNRRPAVPLLQYMGVMSAAFLVSLIAGWSGPAPGINGYAYDWLFRVQPPKPWAPTSALLAIDEISLGEYGGMRHIRRPLADAISLAADAKPTTLAIDLILSDTSTEVEDAALETALTRTPNLVLASDLLPGGETWEDPLPRFAKHAAAIGHVHADPDPVSRVLPLYKAAGHQRRWAIALEALRLSKHVARIEESPDDLRIGSTVVPIVRDHDPSIRIRYLPPLEDGSQPIPQISVSQLLHDPALAKRFAGKAVFVGVTALSAARDRLMTPYNQTMSGLAIHAQAYETLSHGEFLIPASNLAVLGICFLLAVMAGVIFYLLPGWRAYLMAPLVLATAHAIPHVAFANGILVPYVEPIMTAWLTVVTAAAWVYFAVRRQLRKSEADKARYQHAIHLVTHEMRSPLTAIQGSSELMGRYNLTDDKRKQMAQMINSESKRLARMIQTFLDIERLTEGQMDFRVEPFELQFLIDICMQRAMPLAERKQIAMRLEGVDPATLEGDRELMEYAVYNLLTNAIKYSPAGTMVTVRGTREGGTLRISVADQGIGMDEKELRNIFRKFYRTKKAETSGEVGTGIGLSLVEQIVAHHGGKVEVTSTPGKGSCFTIVLPRGITGSAVPASTLVPSN